MSNLGSIHTYRSEVDRIKRYGGSTKETSIRRAVFNLINAYARPRDLLLVEELDYYNPRRKNRVTPDGTLKNILRLDCGFWESKDTDDDLSQEIAKKFDKGYPDSNILFEDSQTAILYQDGQRILTTPFTNDAALDELLTTYVTFESRDVREFKEAVEHFKQDIPSIVTALRDMIQQQGKANPGFRQRRDTFLDLCRTAINPAVTPADVDEMLIQHILTEEIFLSIFSDIQFLDETTSPASQFLLAGPRSVRHLSRSQSPAPMPVKVEPSEKHPDLLTLPPNGTIHELQGDGLQLQYEATGGQLFCGDSLAWLATLKPASIDLCFADPPYNIKKAEWDTFESHESYVRWSKQWVELAVRALKPTGSLYICGFSEVLADIKVAAMPFFRSCRWLVWHYKNKANLGNDWGRSHESILHLRKGAEFTMNIEDVRIPYGAHTLKYPQHPQALTSQFGQGKERDADWTPNPAGAKPKDVFDIPTTCNGMGEKTAHPTQKPEELLRKIVLASSNPGDLIADPFSGSGTTCVVAEQLGRRWLGCDANSTYNQWAIERLNAVPQKPVAVWMELDRKTAARRESIR